MKLKINNEENLITYWVFFFSSIVICLIPVVDRYSFNFEQFINYKIRLGIIIVICLVLGLVYLQSKLFNNSLEYPYRAQPKDVICIFIYLILVTALIFLSGANSEHYILFVFPVAICALGYGRKSGITIAIVASAMIFTYELFFRFEGPSYNFDNVLIQIAILILLGYLIGGITDNNKKITSHLIFKHRFLNQIVNNLPLGIITVNKDKQITFYNRHQASMLGITDETKSVGEVDINKHFPVINENMHIIDRVIDTGKPAVDFSGQVVKKDKTIEVVASAYSLEPEQQEALVIIKDISQQLEAENWKRKSQHILESLNVGIVFVDKAGFVELCNHAANSILQLDNCPMKGLFVEFLYDNCSISDEQYNRLVTESTVSLEIEFNDKIILISKCPIIQGEQKYGDMYVLNDVTELRRLDSELRKAATLSIIGEVAAGTVHEIKNPLTVIKGFVQLIQSNHEKTIGEYQDYFQMVIKETERIEKILSEFLLLARPRKSNFNNLNVNNVISEVWGLIESYAASKNINTRINLKEELPEIFGDAEQIKQVILNIAKNACDAVYDGGLIKIKSYTNSQGAVCVDIEDNGKGIPEAMLNQIFNPFFTTKDTGTGLGLAISNRIMSDHRGEILVQSNTSKGTTFTLVFPQIASMS